MKVILLGSNGWYHSRGQETTSVLIYDEETCIIIDAGTGLLNLKKYIDIVNKYDKIHLFLSHYHYDHTLGLTLIEELKLHDKLVIYSADAYNKTPGELLQAYYKSPYVGGSITGVVNRAKFVSYTEHDVIHLGETKVSFYANVHSDQSYSFNINDEILVSTDNDFAQSERPLNKFKLALIEIWDFAATTGHMHTPIETIFNYLDHNEVKAKLVAIHQNPAIEGAAYELYKKTLEDRGIICGADNLKFDV